MLKNSIKAKITKIESTRKEYNNFIVFNANDIRNKR